jgi:hypothetical protein
MSFDIGLEHQDGNLSIGVEIPETVGKRAEILEKFYGEPLSMGSFSTRPFIRPASSGEGPGTVNSGAQMLTRGPPHIPL